MSDYKINSVNEFMVKTKQIPVKEYQVNCNDLCDQDKRLLNLQITLMLEKLQSLLYELYDDSRSDTLFNCFIDMNKERNVETMFNTVDKESIAMCVSDFDYNINTFASLLNIPLDECFKEIHKSNLTKIDTYSGRTHLRADGKVIPAETYTPPDLKSILEK